jgi:hypothetical protein
MSNDYNYKFSSNVGILATEIDSVDMSNMVGAIGAAGSTDTIDISPYVFNWNSSAYTISTGTGGTGSYYTSTSTGFKGIEVKDGADIKIGERSLSEFMDRVESRLAILQPKPELLEKFEALQKAYDQYKLLEALCMGNIPMAPDDHV